MKFKLLSLSFCLLALTISAQAQVLGSEFWQPQPGSPLEAQLLRCGVEQRDWLRQMQGDEFSPERILLEIGRREVWAQYARRLGAVRRSSARVELVVCAISDEPQERCFNDGPPATIRNGDTFCERDGPCWTFWGFAACGGAWFGVYEAANATSCLAGKEVRR